MFRLEIATNNAAFNYAHDELGRIFANLSNQMYSGEASLTDGGIIKDVNGNTVGQWQFTDENETVSDPLADIINAATERDNAARQRQVEAFNLAEAERARSENEGPGGIYAGPYFTEMEGGAPE